MTPQGREQATTTQQQHRIFSGREMGCNQEAELNMTCSGLFHTTLPAELRPVVQWGTVRVLCLYLSFHVVCVSLCVCCFSVSVVSVGWLRRPV